MNRFEFRVAGADEWLPVSEEMEDGNTVCFMMDDQQTDYVTFDAADGKVEYRRTEAGKL